MPLASLVDPFCFSAHPVYHLSLSQTAPFPSQPRTPRDLKDQAQSIAPVDGNLSMCEKFLRELPDDSRPGNRRRCRGPRLYRQTGILVRTLRRSRSQPWVARSFRARSRTGWCAYRPRGGPCRRVCWKDALIEVQPVESSSKKMRETNQDVFPKSLRGSKESVGCFEVVMLSIDRFDPVVTLATGAVGRPVPRIASNVLSSIACGVMEVWAKKGAGREHIRRQSSASSSLAAVLGWRRRSEKRSDHEHGPPAT